jgi:hypothetical protein
MSLLHESLYFRHMYTVRLPRREGVCQQYFFKLTMPVKVVHQERGMVF